MRCERSSAELRRLKKARGTIRCQILTGLKAFLPQLPDASVTFSAACSRFVDEYVWTVEGPSGESVPLLGAHTANPAFVADAFCASRLGGDGGRAFGTLPAETNFGAILERALNL